MTIQDPHFVTARRFGFKAFRTRLALVRWLQRARTVRPYGPIREAHGRVILNYWR